MDDIEALLVPEYNIHENNPTYLNIREGGGNGGKNSLETKQKISNSVKNFWLGNDEEREKVSLRQKKRYEDPYRKR